MNQAEWAGEVVRELEGVCEVSALVLLDALGICGLELVPGDGAATAFWELLISEVREVG